MGHCRLAAKLGLVMPARRVVRCLTQPYRRLDPAQGYLSKGFDLDCDIAAIVGGHQITIEFQPIIDVRSRILLAYEALARGPADSPLHRPLALFAAAREARLMPQLELVCLAAAMRAAAEAQLVGRLFINVSPHSLLAAMAWPQELEKLCRLHDIEPAACVIELTEQALLEDFDQIRGTLRTLRACGFDVAIDDFGTGYSGLRMWSEVRPDFIKIDGYFARGIERDPVKLEFVRSIIDMARAVGSNVIVEGVETLEQCRELLDLDIDGLQGYLFGRPQPILCSAADALAPLASVRPPEPLSTARDLIIEVPPVHPDMRISAFIRLVQERPQCAAFPIVGEDGVPLGMIWRDRFLVTYSKPLHPEALARKPVSTLMDRAPVIVDERLRLEQTSRLVTRKSRIDGMDQFIIVRNGLYAGIGHTIDLLIHITERRVRAATYSNPLTALPGNVPIRDRITRIIEQNRAFVVCYVDLDNFKPFNDHYGYAKGDQVLLQLAQVLVSSIARRTDFIGHIGGDDFVLLLRSPDWAVRLVRVIDEFRARIHNLYSAEDVARGGIEACDRHGERRLFSLPTLSLATIDGQVGKFRNAEEVSESLQAAKRRAKAIDGNCLWHEGPDGGRNLLEDPELLAQAVRMSTQLEESGSESGTYDNLSKIEQVASPS